MGQVRACGGEKRLPATARLARALSGGASLLALCGVAVAAPAFAQTTAATGQSADAQTADSTQVADNNGPPGSKDIVVTGIRASLANSQEIKRNADTVVDAITAQDIGALPDRSVTEALQRVPGVAMNRFAGSNDPDHFSVEGSGVVVRGLTFVRSEFNGRDTFSAGVYGQAINFSDVPSELLGSVEVYKNATADMIEGGLAGTVNLNTRVPLDNKGFHIAWDTEMNWGDMEKKWAPTDSLLVSNTWETGIGTIGLLGDFSYSQLRSRSDGIQVTNFQTRDNTATIASNTSSTLVCRNPLPTDDDSTTLPPAWNQPAGTPPCGTASTPGADGLADPSALQYAPLGGQFRTQDYDRQRKGIALAAQWESLDHRAKLTAQFLRTDSVNNWGEHTFESAPDLSEYNTYPAGCRPNGNGPGSGPGQGGSTRAECPIGAFQNYQYDDNGVFESGYITLPGSGWRSGNGDSGGTWKTVTGGMQQSLSRRQVHDQNIVADHGLNFKFHPNDHWDINLDADYTKAKHNTLDVSVFGSTFADEELDISGDLPRITPHEPLFLAANWAGGLNNCNLPTKQCTLGAGASADLQRHYNETDAQYFSDPANQFWRAAMDHIEHSVGTEWAFKGDVAYNFDDPDFFLKSIKVGARYADRDETVRATGYNWGALSEVWSGSAVYLDQAGGDHASFYDFDNFFRGQTPGPVGGFYYNRDLIADYAQFGTFAKGIHDIWTTTNGASNTGWVPLDERPGVIAGTPFLPTEIQQVSETNKNAYLMLTFGRDEPLFGNIRLSGNIGVRYVDTIVTSAGNIGVPTAQQAGVTEDYDVRCAPVTNPQDPTGPKVTPGGICNLGPTAYAALQTFADGSSTPDVARHHYHYFLPSLNLKFGLTSDLILRFAASRVLARPSMGDIRNFITTGFDNTTNQLSATAGNPFLKPAIGDQFDLTLEWYFARVGSLTVDAFYKNIQNFFYQSITPRSITNNGVTETVQVRGPANYNGSGKIKGVEVAYQQTFDFLPGFLSGLGVNATYTYLNSKGLPNSFLNNGAVPNNSTIPPGNLPLEQLSKHNINLTGFYEKGPISIRAAYNWRSKFLLTATDVIFPYYPIFNASTGQLDASIFYSLNKNIKIGVQGVNLTNEVTKTLQQFTTDGLLGPRSYFMNDRRYSFILRANF
ncbi:MAG TPA: TonB-dependent receptor [Sphingomonas sp.]|nr:TonB-dependent receptor [Sphingomonas sp.]